MKMTNYEFSVYRHPPLLGEHTEEVFAEWLNV
jgi:crotonobetainyl-CoA:carnitine CoA-transferase CaiB-like acyl-CoA transferase